MRSASTTRSRKIHRSKFARFSVRKFRPNWQSSERKEDEKLSRGRQCTKTFGPNENPISTYGKMPYPKKCESFLNFGLEKSLGKLYTLLELLLIRTENLMSFWTFNLLFSDTFCYHSHYSDGASSFREDLWQLITWFNGKHDCILDQVSIFYSIPNQTL